MYLFFKIIRRRQKIKANFYSILTIYQYHLELRFNFSIYSVYHELPGEICRNIPDAFPCPKEPACRFTHDPDSTEIMFVLRFALQIDPSLAAFYEFPCVTVTVVVLCNLHTMRKDFHTRRDR